MSIDKKYASSLVRDMCELKESDARKSKKEEFVGLLNGIKETKIELDSDLYVLLNAAESQSSRNNDDNEEVLKLLYGSLHPHQVKQVYAKKGRFLKGCVSFRESLSIRTAKKQIGGKNAEWNLNNKVRGAKYVAALGINTPKQLGVFDTDAVKGMNGVLIKPAEGANAVNVFHLEDGIVLDLKNKKYINSLEEFHSILDSSKTKKWVVEEYISDGFEAGAPARDIKFYCFYGKVALALEVLRYPEVKYCWWNRESEKIDTGLYAESALEGVGFDEEEAKNAELISETIPAPFVRIDFLKGKKKTLFGEFTPRPGNFEQFNDEFDFILGKEFLLAEDRLQNDLFKGKSFQFFKNFFKIG
ncbi:ATP-grasp fold amidoligase family protein [Halomonas sp. PR-M31]|uniref:ATP-grasp fold amidoligase family protein n=1 Tax=Halomonas sp. PR-M31 TaxID=1471202 RepID=UPI00069FCA82|nr:ATP-grasp fold amidoligase family protein [Halomonas sp. PR-M31]